MLKKVINLIVVFAVITAIFTPLCDTVLTAGEITIPIIIGIVITRLYYKEILAADNAAVRIKNILTAVTSMIAVLLLVAMLLVEIEALDWTYIKFEDAAMVMMIMGIVGTLLELAEKGVIKLIRRFSKSSK